jgi:hypothetical protein
VKIQHKLIHISTIGVFMVNLFSFLKLSRCLNTLMTIGVVVFGMANSGFAAFSSGSNGSDGALEITTPGKTIFDPKALGIDNDSDNVFHFTTINIAASCTLRLGADVMGPRPVYFLASGNVTISGVIDLNGEHGHAYNAAHKASIAGAGGYSGGIGYQSGMIAATPGEGPGGGGIGTGSSYSNCSYGAGAGYKVEGTVYACSGYPCCPIAGKMYGNKYLLPLLGGSGGGGGTIGMGSGGGAGGGALCIASSGTVVLNGRINAKGGNGGTTYSGYYGGGGGSGGAVRIVANIASGTGIIDVYGGGGTGSGSTGYIRVEAYQNSLSTSNMLPSGIFATPGLPLFPAPGSLPGVKIVTINGVTVPANPNGSYTVPDVTINKGDTSTIIINARLIPTGTPVTLTLNSENEGILSFTTPPLSGTLDSSTATTRLIIPPGYSKLTLNASW